MAFAGYTPDPTTDTVLSGPTLDGLDWHTKSLMLWGPATFPSYPGPNQPPVPSATISCVALTCSLDASSTTDDGSIVYYGWDFGDGTTGTGVTATHGYSAPGTYTVTLSVIDDRRAKVTWTQDVTVANPSTPVSFVGTSDVNANSAAPKVSIPSGTQTGDTEVLVVSTGAVGASTTPPPGWQLLTRRANTLETSIYTHVAADGDPATVTVPLTATTRADVTLAVYRGVSAVSAVTGAAVNTATLPTPAASVTAGGSWVVSYWAQRSSSTTAWALPGSVVQRGAGVGAGGGHVDVAFGDTGTTLGTGTYPAQVATTSPVATKAITAAIVLAPGA